MKEFMQARNYWRRHNGSGSVILSCSLCSLCLWAVLSFLNIMKYIENIERIRMVSEAAKHMKMHTPPIVRVWGSIICVSHWVCPTCVSIRWLRWPIFSNSLMTYLVSPWWCGLWSSILPWAPCRDRKLIKEKRCISESNLLGGDRATGWATHIQGWILDSTNLLIEHMC